MHDLTDAEIHGIQVYLEDALGAPCTREAAIAWAAEREAKEAARDAKERAAREVKRAAREAKARAAREAKRPCRVCPACGQDVYPGPIKRSARS